jgi:site-specific recombinase XerD
MPTIQEAHEEFILACAADRLSPRTIDFYQWHLGAALAGLAAELPLEDVTPRILREYFTSLSGLSDETIRGRHRALRRFFNWCAIEYNMDRYLNPMRNIRAPRAPKPLPKASKLDDVIRLMGVCGNDPAGKRDLAIIATLADTGIRAGGLINLHPDSVDLVNHFIIVTEKGNRARRVPILDFTAVSITEWLKVRPPIATTVFCAVSPHVLGQPLTVSGLNQLLKRLKRRAGVVGRVNPHAFRHMFGEIAGANGMDSAFVSKIMGHSSIKVTVDTYMQFSIGQLARMHEEFGPLRTILEQLEVDSKNL